MKSYSTKIILAAMVSVLLLSECTQSSGEKENIQTKSAAADYGGFESQVKWGEHIVTISACHDCHSPKKMTAHGPDIDSSLLLSGHPSKQPPPAANRKDLETKGLVLSDGSLTSWVGPWGISYTANLTSDDTGIGNWTEEQFMYALKEGKFKGLAGSRSLLPPMPWQMYRHMTDDEMKAVFAYLKSTRPISNVVPAPVPPALAQQQSLAQQQ